MSYGRARLWLGITGVGSLVVVAATALISGLPHRFSSEPTFRSQEVLQLVACIAAYLLWLAPMDFLGGFWLPKRFSKSDVGFGHWLQRYWTAASFQALLFLVFGSLIILSSQSFGILGSLTAISVFIIAGVSIRNVLITSRACRSKGVADRILEACDLARSWQISVPRTVVVEHDDVGFTGGIIGTGRNATIVIPKAWLSFTIEELATVVARRSLAISTGSYTRGLIVAFGWNFVGFFLCSLIPAGGVASVSGLVATVCGFTLWSFLGLLILPTVSRNASLMIDYELVQHGVPTHWISSTASTLDQLQDDEPDRPRLIETIFHPVPSVNARNRPERVKGFAAWNVARTTLFFSWACLGFLSRSVHCNLGRPELWTMLPTD